MELKKLKSASNYDQEDLDERNLEELEGFNCKKSDDDSQITGKAKSGSSADAAWEWGRKSLLILTLTILTSSQGILIAWSKNAGHYDYSVTSANWLVELLKCLISVSALGRVWLKDGITEENKLDFHWDEIKYCIFFYVDAPSYQVLKNMNLISTGILYRLCLSKRLTCTQWVAFALLILGSTTAQLKPLSTHVLQIPFEGWIIAIVKLKLYSHVSKRPPLESLVMPWQREKVMAFLSGFAGVLSEKIIKKRPSKDINVHNTWLYIFGILFNLIAIIIQEYDSILNKGLFHGYRAITMLMVLNHALSGIAVSLVLKYSDNIVKVYSTSIAMFLTAFASAFLFGFQITIPFCLGSMVVAIAVYLHSHGKGGW